MNSLDRAARFFARTLESPRATTWLALGVLTLVWLPVPIVMGGHGSWDDWWFRAAYEGLPTYGTITPADPYRFSDGDPRTFREGIESGFGVWFAHPEVRVALWRPLSALTHYLDHRLWGFDSHFAYVHSYLWLVLQVVAGHAFFRRILRPREAGLATLILAWATSHAEAITWIAARNSQVAAALGTLALARHAAAREGGSRRLDGLGPLLFGLALLGGETGLGTACYLLVYELTWAPRAEEGGIGALTRALTPLAPYALVALAWLAAYTALGYGTAHSGYYINPLHEPLRFLSQLPERWLTLEGGAFVATPMALWLFRPDSRPALMLAGVLAVALVVFGAWLLRDERRARRAALALALAGSLSVLPQLSGFPCARSLLLPSVGAAGFFGVLLMGGVERRAALGWAPRLLLGAVATLQLLLSPLGWFSATRVHGGATLAEERVFEASELDGIAGQRVVVLASPDPVMAGYLGVRARLLKGLEFQSWLVLSHSQVSHRVERTAANEFVLVQTTRPPPYFEDVFRDPGRAEELGRYRFSYFSSEPEEVEGTWRKRVRFTFVEPLDDPGYVFLTYRDGAMRRVTWPPVGGTLELPFEKGPWNLF